MPKASDKASDDAMTEEMADEAMKPTNEEWEDVRVGLGRGWDLEKDGPLEGVYLDVQDVDIPKEKQQTGPDGKLRETAKAFQFALTDGSSETVFLWESHELTAALDEIGIGEKVRITYLGRENFTDGKGEPRQVKRYRVQKAKTPA